MAVFLIIVLSIYSLVNIYLFIRGWQGLEALPYLRPYYTALFVVLFLSYIIGRILMKVSPGVFSGIMMWTGSYYMVFMLYFFLLIVLFDLFRLLNLGFHFFPAFILASWAKFKAWTFLISLILISALVLAGSINAARPVVRKLSLHIDKPAGKLTELKIVMISDLHLGAIIGKTRLEGIIGQVNELKPDIILLAGDVIDEDVEPVMKHNLGPMLREFRSKYGVYAVPGNHEYIGGAERCIAYLQENGVKVLRDSTTRIDSSFLLVGRDDRDRPRFAGGTRAELSVLLEEEDHSQPIILMDHQPFSFDKAVEAGVDLQFSGHTHAGQIWPLNYITAAIYELDHGYLKKGNTHFYVSNGIGTWGPPVRIGNRPEIVEVHLTFSQQQ